MSATPISASVFYLPDLGEGLLEATVLSWLVSPGDPVEEGQPIVEVETAKSAVEIPAGFTGSVTELHAQPGDVVGVGLPLFSFVVERDEGSAGGVVGIVPRGDDTKPRRRVRLRPPDDA